MLMFIFHPNALANDGTVKAVQKEPMLVSMTVSPDQCIAMTEGQTCYVDIEINWQSSAVGDFCLFDSSQTAAIQCWTQKSKGVFQQEMASKKNVIYSLRRQQDSLLLSKTELEMAWVHKKRGKPTTWWRLF